MSKTIFSLILASLLLTGALVVLQAQSINTTQDGFINSVLFKDVTPLVSDENELSFILKTSQVEYSAKDMLTGHGLNAVMQEPGAPELPYFSTFIAIPPEAEVSIAVLQEDMSWLSNVSVNAVAEPTLSFENSDPNSPFPVTAVSPQPAIVTPNPAIYTSDSLYPNHFYQLSEPFYFRDMRLMQLDLYPVQYNPVRQELLQTQQLQVNIKFEGSQIENLQPAPSKDDAYQSSVEGMILNFEQGKAWRSLPQNETTPQLNSLAETAVSIPLGTESFKIKIDQDGIYDILGSDLAAAGMNISSVNPANIQIMSHGEDVTVGVDVAYEFIKVGGNNAILQNNDIIRFYGEGVNGSRRKKQFLTHNVYWLWANGTATAIANEDNLAEGTPVTTFTDSITREDENYFFSTWTNQWDEDHSDNPWNDFPNEADSWYWERWTNQGTKTFTLDLLDPVLDDNETATYTVEFLSRENKKGFLYQFETCLNSAALCTQREWTGQKNINVTETVSMTALISGTNVFTVTLSNPNSIRVKGYLNRITIDYLRLLKAKDDQLFFTDEVGGRAMAVQDFSEGDNDNILVWDITTPKNPVHIPLENEDIAVNNGRYTYTIGIDSSSAQNYIATTTANTISLLPDQISKYTAPTNLEPTNGADWVAIYYGDFESQANTLANHREKSRYGGFDTHIVDIEDIVNVYGNGLPMSEAIHAYLEESLTWPTVPSYVLLLGDGVVSPRNLHCLASCYDDWDMNAQNLVPTDMQFKDRYQGLVPSDNTMVFLVGNDLLPDMAIGRLPAETQSEATSMVDKIIKYEENLFDLGQETERVLFLADEPDDEAGGSFCDTNKLETGMLMPTEYEQIHLCIEDYGDPPDATQFLEAIKNEVYEGVSFMNYRGHGSIHAWGGNPAIWDASSTVSDQELKNVWANETKPVVILSADCLDGHFAWPGHSALSERFLGLNDLAGSAAHWSSAGLGLDHEHTILLEGFYQGAFDNEQIRIGDTVNYAKLHFYISSSYKESEMYSFNLQGDPAMQIIFPDYELFLPTIIK